MRIEDLNVDIFADVASLQEMERLNTIPYVKGFTTNPTLMRKAGVTNYEDFARKAIDIVGNKPISFEVFADDFPTMERQARKIASWGGNVYVKIPITNSQDEASGPLIERLLVDGIKVNVTAVMTYNQVAYLRKHLRRTPCIVSVFAGRISDTGVDAERYIQDIVAELAYSRYVKVLWASTREVYNVVQANRVGCQIITVTPDILGKLSLLGMGLDQYSLETVKMFHEDGSIFTL